MSSYRDIEFRAKKLDGSEWVYGDLLHLHNGKDTVTVIKTSTGVYEEILIRTICQYAGFEDKEGNKIFEGDILKCNSRHYGIVSYRGFGWELEEKMYLHRALTDRDTFDVWTVSGNIYGNPEIAEKVREGYSIFSEDEFLKS